MGTNVLPPAKAVANVGQDPDHRIFLALGRRKCDLRSANSANRGGHRPSRGPATWSGLFLSGYRHRHRYLRSSSPAPSGGRHCGLAPLYCHGAMSTDQDKQPRFRSPPFPYIGLGKALQRTEQLYEAVRHHSAAIPTAAKAWGTGAKSSATLQSIGALIQYGLLDDEGSGPNRRIKLTPLARRIVMERRPLNRRLLRSYSNDTGRQAKLMSPSYCTH